MHSSKVAEIYGIVEGAILAHASSAVVPGGTTEGDVRNAVREVMRDNPGFFWFSHQWIFGKDKNRIHLRYTLSKGRTLKASKSIDDVVGIDYFFDRHNLRSGDVYSERIFEYIDKADLFMLCWSANARKSEYVRREIERALSHVYPQVARDSETLKIHPISIEPRADFPPSMRDIYHFEEL